MHTQEEIESSKLELAEDMKWLLSNKRFNKVFTQGYLEHGSTFLTKNIIKVKPEHKDAVVEEVVARSIYARYVDGIIEEANSILESREL